MPLVVQEWTLSTALLKPDLSAIPLWVDLKGVPGPMFSHEGLTFFGDIVGRTVKLHPNTERYTRLDVARLLVVVNFEEPLKENIFLRGTDTVVMVSFPWLKCAHCMEGVTWKKCDKARKIKKNDEVREQSNMQVQQTDAAQNDREQSFQSTETENSIKSGPSEHSGQEHAAKDNT